jgi:hypothetical protein
MKKSLYLKDNEMADILDGLLLMIRNAKDEALRGGSRETLHSLVKVYRKIFDCFIKESYWSAK